MVAAGQQAAVGKVCHPVKWLAVDVGCRELLVSAGLVAVEGGKAETDLFCDWVLSISLAATADIFLGNLEAEAAVWAKRKLLDGAVKRGACNERADLGARSAGEGPVGGHGGCCGSL